MDETVIAQSRQQRSMLFEIAAAAAEIVIAEDRDPTFQECSLIALDRQRRHFDARTPSELSAIDQDLIRNATSNLLYMLRNFSEQRGINNIVVRPPIPGFGWIASGVGDFCIGEVLVEVKHTDRNFIANDYRQIILYWALKYAQATETSEPIWDHYLLLNPRLNRAVFGSFDSLMSAASGGLNRVEVYEYLRATITSPSDVRK
jgi:hypothetical protein